MNIHDTNTVKPDPAILSISIDSARMVDMGGDARFAIYDMCTTLSSILSGFSCQPRCNGDKDGQPFNQAGKIICELNEFFDRLKTGLVDVAAATPCEDLSENHTRLFLMLMKEVSYRDEMPKCAAMAAGAVQEQIELEQAIAVEAMRAAQ